MALRINYNLAASVAQRSLGASLSSSFWKGRIDTMVGLRSETASTIRVTTLVSKGPISYDSRTFGLVADTPLRGIRAYASYSTNSKINFTTDRDVFAQQVDRRVALHLLVERTPQDLDEGGAHAPPRVIVATASAA